MDIGRRLRLLLAIFVLLISLAFLAWGFLPSIRERRTQYFNPGELRIPTPVTVLPGPVEWLPALTQNPV